MRQRGFALLVVLLSMGFLALLGTQIVAAGRGDTRLAENLRRASELEAAADGAIAHAVFAASAVRDPAFRPGEAAVQIGAISVRLNIRYEADRVNINTCSLALMQALLLRLGVSASLAGHIAAAVLDWRTGGDVPRRNGGKAAEYRAAGLSYGPPGTPFESVDELRLVLGMTPDLFDRLASHITVLTDSDPDLGTADPLVAQALADAAGVADDASSVPVGEANPVLRITAIAQGPQGGRYVITEVAMADFREAEPKVRVLLRERCPPLLIDKMCS